MAAPGPPPIPVVKSKKKRPHPPPVPPIVKANPKKKRKEEEVESDSDGGKGKRRSKRKRKDPADGAYIDGENERIEEEEEEPIKTVPELVVDYLYNDLMWESRHAKPTHKGDGLTAEEEAELMQDLQTSGGIIETGGGRGDDGDGDGDGDGDRDEDGDEIMYSSEEEEEDQAIKSARLRREIRGSTDPCVYNRQFNQMVNIATMDTTIQPARLLDLKSTAMEMVPVVHEETQAYYKAKLARYERDNYKPYRDPCIICTYGFTDDIDEESNEVVRDFVLIFLEQQDLVSSEVLFTSMCEHWNTKIVGAFKRFETRDKFLLTPSAIEEHFTGGCRFDVSVILRNEIEFVRQLIDHQKVQAVYVARVKYGIPTGVVETDTAQVNNLLKLYRQLVDLVRTQQTFATNSKFITRYGANPERFASGNQSYGKEFNRLGARVMSDKNRLEQSSTKS